MPQITTISIAFKGVRYNEETYGWLVDFELVAGGREFPIAVPVDRDVDDENVVTEGRATLHEILRHGAEQSKGWALP